MSEDPSTEALFRVMALQTALLRATSLPRRSRGDGCTMSRRDGWACSTQRNGEHFQASKHVE